MPAAGRRACPRLPSYVAVDYRHAGRNGTLPITACPLCLGMAPALKLDCPIPLIPRSLDP